MLEYSPKSLRNTQRLHKRPEVSKKKGKKKTQNHTRDGNFSLLPIKPPPLPYQRFIILFTVMVFRINPNINLLFIFGVVCVKSNLCRRGALHPRIPCSLAGGRRGM